ncbi:MAG: class I SAM-dependent methyltransferase [Rhodopirellula sp.]|nr:class I SAM-dependent methyltransferase [Rhodopirellula sp.]
MTNRVGWMALLGSLLAASLAPSQAADASQGLSGEQSLPNRHVYVVQDILKTCSPQKGFWVDLGAGKGQISIPLIEATDNPLVMLDPNAEAMTEGLTTAREKKLEHRLSAVVGVAEAMPFPDNTVDLVVSRGSIFFWDDPAKGLREVWRVLRPGGKAYIGGGAGSGYPKWAVEKLIEGRQRKLKGAEAEKWKRFIELRRPEQMKQWAEAAGLAAFQVMGKGAVSDDPAIGQGVWLFFEKPSVSLSN